MAVVALGKARILLPSFDAATLHLHRDAPVEQAQNGHLPPDVLAKIARVAWAIPRAAKYVPWRADCLVQAKAGQTWLASWRIPSAIKLGARRSPDKPLDAHAWLISLDTVVTGGDIAQFVPFQPRQSDTSQPPS